jgi:HTH-type transcriptional regulator / antitoxin HigA
MNTKPINGVKEYEELLHIVDDLFNEKVKATSREGEKLKTMLLAIKEYEDLHFHIPKPLNLLF